ncbi:hypothetical protein D3C86_1529580 [compost metagenome]
MAISASPSLSISAIIGHSAQVPEPETKEFNTTGVVAVFPLNTLKVDWSLYTISFTPSPLKSNADIAVVPEPSVVAKVHKLLGYCKLIQ